MIHTLENEELRIRINDLGAELSEIYDKTNDRQVLWDADPAYWKRHAPILFPNVGRCHSNQYLINGRTYSVGQHGFARDAEFLCTESSDTKITHVLEASEKTKEVYPFLFRLSITHELCGRDLRVSWKVENPDNEPIYFTIGGHPAFRVPVLPDTAQEEYFLTFDGQKELTLSVLDLSTGTVIPKKTDKLSLKNGVCHITPDLFDNDTLIFDNGQVEKAGISFPDGTPYVEVTCKGFSNFGIWRAPGAPFVCLEPWMGRCDNSGFSEELSQKPGINQVEAGEEFSRSYTISMK